MIKYLPALLLLALVLASCSSEPQVEGTQLRGNILMVQGVDSTAGKIFVKDNKYRMELNQRGHDFVVIVDQDSNVTYLLMPPEKIYMDMPTDDQMSLMNDPFQGLKYAINHGTETFLTSERVGGQNCDKYSVSIDSNKIVTYWRLKRFNFPVKIVGSVAPHNTMEMSNIKIAALPDSLFVVPEDFDPYEPGMKRYPVPEWMSQLDTLEILNAPFQREMSVDEVVIVPFEDSTIITVTADNLANKPSRYVALPIHNGKPAADYLLNTREVPSTTESFEFNKTELEAEELAIWVQFGKVMVFVKAAD
jgi:hypothetical protein